MSYNPADIEKEYRKNEELEKEDVRILLEWVEKQPHLPQVTELQAILFLQSCYFRLEAAKSALDNYFTFRTLCPEIFAASLDDPLLKLTMDVTFCSALPRRTPDDYTVYWGTMMDWNPNVYHFNSQTKIADMVTMLDLYTNGTSKGVYIILDMKGTTLSHLARMNVMTMKKFLCYLQEAMPIRLKGVHLINVVPFIDKLMAIIKPFMKKELFDMLHFHNDSIETLYKFVPKELLPEDYGGLAPSKQQLQETTNRKIVENFDLFAQLQRQRVNEKCRPGKPKNASDIFGVDGTFKKLEVD